jgi:signal transduction histidine kinase
MVENARMAEIRERNRIAREVHDTIGHTLTGLAFGIDACEVLQTARRRI